MATAFEKLENNLKKLKKRNSKDNFSLLRERMKSGDTSTLSKKSNFTPFDAKAAYQRNFGKQTYKFELGMGGKGIQPAGIGRTKTTTPTETSATDPLFSFAKEIVQSMMRSGAGLAEYQGLTKGIKPETELQKTVFGTDERITIESVGREWADIVGKGEEIPKEYAIPLGVLGALLDWAPFGSSKLKPASKAIARLRNVDEIIPQVRKVVKGSDDEIRALSEGLKNVSDHKQVRQILKKVDTSPKITKAPTQKVAKPTTEEAARTKAISKKLEDTGLPSYQSQSKQLKKQYPLGREILKGQSSVQKKSLSKAYQLFDDKSRVIKKVDNNLSPTKIKPNPKNVGIFKKFSKKMQDFWIKTNEYIQDDWYRVRRLVQKKGVKVSDESNPYMQRELFFGRVNAKIEEVKDTVSSIDKNIIKTSKKVNVPDKEITDKVNKYLYYKHVPERNKAIGEKAAGISTKEAKQGLKELQNLDYFKDIKNIATKVRNLHNKTLDTLLDGEVITKELYDSLRSKYPNHVPLQRIFEETEDVEQVLTIRGLDVRDTGIKKAVGSEREVADIFENIVQNYEQAVIRAEKNKVDLATLKFVRKNEGFNGLMEIKKSKAIGKTFGDKIIKEEMKHPQILALREKGKPIYIKINNPHLATALRGVNRLKLDGFTRTIGAFTRLYSGLMTRFNPEFAFPNKIRDLQEMAVYMASKKEVGFKGASKAIVRDPKSTKHVMDYLRGKNTRGARLYKELQMEGGTTGGLGLSTRKQVELDIQNIRDLNRKKPKKAARQFLDYVDAWNTVFEDSTRLSVYDESLKRGMSKQQAAQTAKEATINFNRMGTGGPMINSLYMFANASIQGSVKMLRSMKNPKVLSATVGTMTGAVFASQEWNDSIDSKWRQKVSEWDRMNGITIVLPSEKEKFNYVTIPVSWGLKPINTMSNFTVDALNDQDTSLREATSGIFASVMDAYNPVGGTDVFSAATPTILDLPLEIARNQKWSGSMIRPDWHKYAPKSEQYFDSLKDKEVGKMAIDITRKIADESGGRIEISPSDATYAFDQYVGGTGRFLSESYNAMADLFRGKVKLDEVPFINRFFRKRDVEETGYGASKADEVKDILTEQSRERLRRKRESEAVYEEFKKLPEEQAAQAFDDLVKRDEKLAEEVSEIAQEEERGLTYADRLIKQLGVGNGERAKYLKLQFDKLDSKEKKAELWEEMVDKKIISDRVAEQLIYLLNQ